MRKEVPGFLANRLQAALVREAIALLGGGVATPQDVDHAIKFGLSRRWEAAGVLELFDLAGWDTILAAAFYIPPDLESSPGASALREKAERGEVGAKSGRRYYEWTPRQAAALKKRIAEALLRR
ncbi:MAG: hypothetical protein HY858_14115 [Candidatus Solibacter usitatus]|nr:hypothetical protein [Candidatus Solibacter usitatus]